MQATSVGVIIIVISTLGYFSNWLNSRFLNYKINYLLYYFGAFVHETSHAVFCFLTRAKISEYRVFVKQPHVTYSNPRLPMIGNLLISVAPIFGGLTLLFFVNKHFLVNQFVVPAFSDRHFFLRDFLNFITQINPLNWKNLLALFLFLNIGAMISPSLRDLKNVWFLMLVLLFISWPFFTPLGLLAISLILINIIFQIALIAVVGAGRREN